MPKVGVDNFTKIVKYELITKEYSQAQIKFVLFGYCFQDFLQFQKKLNFRFNLISDFILKNLSSILHFALQDLQKHNQTIQLETLTIHDSFQLFLIQIWDFLNQIEKKQVAKNDFTFFLVGWFLRSGSIANLTSHNYHLELKLKAIEFFNLFQREFDYLHLDFKSLQRETHVLFYLKKIDEISDFLKLIGAIESMMQLETNRIQKDRNNFLQRWENLDLSNALKTNFATNQQLEIIKQWKKSKQFDALDKKTQFICEERLTHRNLSLSQFVTHLNHLMHDDQYVTKSQVAYLFRKLKLGLKK